VVLNLSYNWLVAFLIVFARALGWLVLVPPFSNRATIPPIVTLCLSSGLALLIGPSVPIGSLPTTAPTFMADLVLQVLTGAALGFIVYVLLTTVTAAGSFLDQSGGLNLPPSVDPLSLNQTPMLGQLYEQIATVLLFVSGGYWLLIAGFARSFQSPGFTLGATGRIVQVAVVDLATLFTSSLEIAAPILVVLFGTQIVLAVLSKAAPQVNVWILGMPIQVFVAIALVAVGISALPSYVSQLLSRALTDSAYLFGGR